MHVRCRCSRNERPSLPTNLIEEQPGVARSSRKRSGRFPDWPCGYASTIGSGRTDPRFGERGCTHIRGGCCVALFYVSQPGSRVFPICIAFSWALKLASAYEELAIVIAALHRSSARGSNLSANIPVSSSPEDSHPQPIPPSFPEHIHTHCQNEHLSECDLRDGRRTRHTARRAG